MDHEFAVSTGQTFAVGPTIPPCAYLNVGCWCNGRTDFAIVHKGDIALCSWMNFTGEKDLGINSIHSKKIKDILNSAGKAVPAGRPCVLQYLEFPDEPLTRDEPLVFIGDLHMSLFRETPLDAFTVSETQLRRHSDGDPDRSRSSLYQYFFSLVNHLAGEGLGSDQIIQCGDCFEIWHVQIIFDLAYDFICRHHDEEEIGLYTAYEKTTRTIYTRTGHYTVPSLAFEAETFPGLQGFLGKERTYNARRSWWQDGTIAQALLLAINDKPAKNYFMAEFIDWLQQTRDQAAGSSSWLDEHL